MGIHVDVDLENAATATLKRMSSQNDVVAISGTGLVAGVAYATAVWSHPRPELPAEPQAIPADQVGAEYDRFIAAADAVAARLDNRSAAAEGAAREVLAANAGMARDRGWRKVVRKNVKSGQDAGYATVAATEKFVSMFNAAGGVMAERTTDLKDIRDRVIAELRGEEEPGLPAVDGEAVLFADDLAPSDTARLDVDHFRALVTELGGPTSHTAILARQLNIPCIVAVGPSIRDIATGDTVLVDGGRGTITTGADPEEARQLVERSRQRAAQIAAWTGPAQTSDGHRIQLLANVQDPDAARFAARSQAEGIGLYRTEMSFLAATEEPTVAEQADLYKKVFDAFPDSKVVIRTLDAGSDKPIAFANLSKEDNPALGVRGLRIARHNDELLTRQLDAIAQAAEGRSRETTWVMAPMVATAREAKWFAGLCKERGLTAGAMIEVPAAALMADKIMPQLDFVSIGTNDLTQYTMAADRLSPQLAYLTDSWQPAVLRLIEKTCQVGAETGTAVGVCGEAAADSVLAVVLAGLGVNSLSAASAALPGVGVQLGEVSWETCKKAADAALSSWGAHVARDAVRKVLEEARR